MTQREMEDLKTKIQTFRVSDLQTLVSTVGRSRNGKKQELQNRVFEILRTQPSDVSISAFKAKIHELYRLAQEEAKQSHYDYQLQRPVTQPRGPSAYVTVNPYSVQQPQPGRTVGTVVYQNGGIIGGNGYPNANMYPNPGNTPTIQPPSMIASNIGNTVQIISSSISPAHIRFRLLPFYKVKHEILKPTILKLKVNGRPNAGQLFQISFVLTCEIASEISMNRDLTKNEYSVQAQLRICALDNNNASTNETTEYDDLLPLGLYVRMNDKQCALPPCSPCTRPNVEARRIPLPINVTSFMKLSPMNVNKLTINWNPEVNRTFVMSLNVVEKLTSSYLLERLKERPPISVDITKQTIAKQYKRVIDDDDEDSANADDDDIATTIVRVSLQCPLAKFRMMYPAKGRNCSHLQCFDGFAYISCNEKKSVWMCPVCNRSLYYADLLIDQYFVDVLASEQSADCQEVQLFVDGSWKVYDEENAADGNDGTESRNSVSHSPNEYLSVSNSGGNSNHVDQKTVLPEPVASAIPATAPTAEPVVDLTMEDDEDEEEDNVEKDGENERPRSETSAQAGEKRPGDVSDGSQPASPEMISQPAASSVPTSPAPVTSAPGSPATHASQTQSQDEAGLAPTQELNPMVMSPSPSPDSRKGVSQEAGAPIDDALDDGTTLDDSMEDRLVIDVPMDDPPTDENSFESAQEMASETNSPAAQRRLSSDVPVSDTPANAAVGDRSENENTACGVSSISAQMDNIDEDCCSSTAASAPTSDSPSIIPSLDCQSNPSSPPPSAMAALTLDGGL